MPRRKGRDRYRTKRQAIRDVRDPLLKLAAPIVVGNRDHIRCEHGRKLKDCVFCFKSPIEIMDLSGYKLRNR